MTHAQPPLRLLVILHFHSVVQLLVCFQCLEQVLLFTAAPPTSGENPTTSSSGEAPPTVTPTSSLIVKQYHTIGHRLVQKLLAQHLKCFYHSLMSSLPMKLVGACLRLLAAMVMQGADSAREVQLVFNFSYKPLAVLVNKTTPISVSHVCNPTPSSLL